MSMSAEVSLYGTTNITAHSIPRSNSGCASARPTSSYKKFTGYRARLRWVVLLYPQIGPQIIADSFMDHWGAGRLKDKASELLNVDR
jgi:hypothetical protein